MSSILKKPNKKANLGRNGFDLSRRRAFSSPVGMLLPVFKNFAYSGEKVKANTSTFIRTEALQTAAFLRMRHHVDWFFVPIFNLYKFWNEYYNNTNDVHTDFIPETLDVTRTGFSLPTFNLGTRLFGLNLEDDVDNYFYKFTAGAADNKNYQLYLDEFGVPKAWNARRLADMFGYGSPDRCNYLVNGNVSGLNIHLLYYLAYHAVWYSHYNNSQFFENKPYMYNCDSMYGMSWDGGQTTTGLINKAFDIISTIHYRPFRRDYFTNIQPSPIATENFSNFLGGNQFRMASLSSVDLEGFEKLDDTYLSGQLGIVVQTPENTALNIASLRSLYAYDKLLRVTASTGSHYDQQTLAHLGYKVPQGVSQEPYFLGSQSFDVIINEVVATATTAGEDGNVKGAGTVIGDIAGKAFGSTGKEQDVEFTAPCEGIFLAISSIEPLCDYASFGCEMENRYTSPFDFWRPEFDNVGMQPMFDPYFSGIIPALSSDYMKGWTYRWSELKTSFDVINEGFWNTSKSTWVAYKQQQMLLPGNTSMPSDLHDLFFIRPQYTNSIFAMPFGAGVNKPFAKDYLLTDQGSFWKSSFNSAQQVYEGDNFLINMDIKFFKTSPMSVHSLPNI